MSAATDGSRKVVVSEFITIDGYIVGPDEDISWVAEGFDPQMQDDIGRSNEEVDVFVFGRVTFDIFAAYWPHAVPYDQGDDLKPAEGKEDPRIIRALNDRPKVLFSTTRQDTDWAPTRIVAAGVEDEIRRLRSEPGSGVVLVQGSASVVQALVRADLVDEYRLFVHPVVLGAGTPLFPTGQPRQDFDLATHTVYANGVSALTFTRRR